MAHAESNIVNEIMLEISKHGGRAWRNVRGMFLTLDGGRKVRAGLQADGASDLVGFMPVTITQEMVGQKIAVMVAIEVKTATGRVSPEQANFCGFIKQNGGKAGIARCADDAIKILLT